MFSFGGYGGPIDLVGNSRGYGGYRVWGGYGGYGGPGLGPPAVAGYPFLGEGSPTKWTKKETSWYQLMLTSLLEDLVVPAQLIWLEITGGYTGVVWGLRGPWPLVYPGGFTQKWKSQKQLHSLPKSRKCFLPLVRSLA